MLLSVLLLLPLLILRVFFSELLIIFCNDFRSYALSQNISARYSISALKYLTLIALARNALNIPVIVPEVYYTRMWLNLYVR